MTKEESDAMHGVTSCGPMKRPVHEATRAPLFRDSEVDSLSAGAKEIACGLPVLDGAVAERWIRSMDGVGHPMQLQFVGGEALREMLATSGEKPGAVLGVVPRLWLLRTELSDVMFAKRLNFKLEPTVLVATCERLYWQVDGSWQSLAYRRPARKRKHAGDGDDDSVPRWSELFGRGPFAAFSHEDLGMDPSKGDPAHLDLYLIREQNTAQTLYGFPGIDRTQVRTWMNQKARGEYQSAGQLERTQERLGEQMREALLPHYEKRKKGGDVLDLRGFYDDLAALYGFLGPMLLQGGFQAFMPRGLDPHGNEDFRFPTVSFTQGEPDVADPVGRPLRHHARRGMTLPMFLEPTGARAGSWLAMLLASLRNAWPAIQAGASSKSIVKSARHRVDEVADLQGSALDIAEQASVADRNASANRSGARKARAAAVVAALEGVDQGHTEARIERLRTLLRSEPDNAEAMRALATMLRQEELPREALQFVEAAIELDPTARKHWVAALVHHQLGDAEGHAASLRDALSCWEDEAELALVWTFYVTWKIESSHGDLSAAFEHATSEEVSEALRLIRSCPGNARNDAIFRFLDIVKQGGGRWGYSALQTLLSDLLDGGWVSADPDLLQWPTSDVWINYVMCSKREDSPFDDDERKTVIEKAAPSFEGCGEELEESFRGLKRELEE